MQSSIFSRPVTEVIKERISVRSYEDRPLSDELKQKLEMYLNNLEGPFKSNIRFKLIESENYGSDVKLGTYGVIKGASSYVVSAVEKSEMSLIDLGYALEEFILYATSLGLGTCWLGGTFKKSEFAKAMELKEGEILPIITPLGYASENKNIIGSIIRFSAGSKNRKPWNELFFNGNFKTILTQSEAGDYAEALNMLRLAPSASNKQPWRIVKDGDKFHFFLCHTKGYGKGMGFDVQKIDMGIAMCHFNLLLKEAGMLGNFKKCETNISCDDEQIEYVITFVK